MNTSIEYLKKLQKQMRYEESHDNDNQASPRFWSIMDYRVVPGSEEHDNGFIQYYFNNGDFHTIDTLDGLKEEIRGHYDSEDDMDEILLALLEGESFKGLWEYLERHLNENGYYDKTFVKEENFIVPNTMFITKGGAKNHLLLNRHHYTTKAHTYAMTAWRSDSVSKLWDILLNVDWGKLREED